MHWMLYSLVSGYRNPWLLGASWPTGCPNDLGGFSWQGLGVPLVVETDEEDDDEAA